MPVSNPFARAEPVTCTTLKLRGIDYDAGTNYMGGPLSRQTWNAEAVAGELRVIRQELRCNAVQIFGTSLQRLTEATEIAFAHGLQVWVQPRLFEASQEDVLAYIGEVADALVALRGKRDKPLVLNVGCEFSLFTQGFIAGTTFLERIATLSPGTAAGVLPEVGGAVRAYLKKVAAIARSRFKGEITYSPLPWERVDWDLFDIVSANHYRSQKNYATYLDKLRRLMEHGKPVVITEFGSSTFEGAEKYGAMGYDIVDYEQDPPRVKAGFVRSEQTQAKEIAELLGIFEEEKIGGAFVYHFLSEDAPYSPDPSRDLDMASHAIVKVLESNPERGTIRWEPKLAFHAIARIYGREACP